MPQHLIPTQVKGLSHNMVEQAAKRYRSALQEYVLDKQKEIKFGEKCDVIVLNNIEFDEVEYDMSSYRRQDLDGGIVKWQDYEILKRRGHAASLLIRRREDDKCYSSRS